MEPIRVLHIVSTMDFGGVETLLMSIYRNIDREKIQFDFLCHNRLECKFKSEIESMGGRVYMIPGPSHIGFVRYGITLRNFCKEHPEYKIAHCHLNSRNGEIIWHLKAAGVPIRISHSHTSYYRMKFPKNIYCSLTKILNCKYATIRLACSEAAAEYLFDNKMIHTIVPNAISPKRFLFRTEGRKRIRETYGVMDNQILIGHVGRFDSEKNHYKVIRVFAECLSSGMDAYLMLIGDGHEKANIIRWAKEANVFDRVFFAGQHAELGDYYSAMDLFLFPSVFEGLGIVAVEAQCSGLPVLASTGVPNEAAVSDRIKFLSLEESDLEWGNVVYEMVEQMRGNRKHYCDVVSDSLYNIQKTTDYLQNLYLSEYKKLFEELNSQD